MIDIHKAPLELTKIIKKVMSDSQTGKEFIEKLPKYGNCSFFVGKSAGFESMLFDFTGL